MRTHPWVLGFRTWIYPSGITIQPGTLSLVFIMPLNLNDMSQEATGKASSFILSISVTDADKGKCLPIDHPPRVPESPKWQMLRVGVWRRGYLILSLYCALPWGHIYAPTLCYSWRDRCCGLQSQSDAVYSPTVVHWASIWISDPYLWLFIFHFEVR